MYAYILVSSKDDGTVQAWESWDESPNPARVLEALPHRATTEDAEDIVDGEMVQFSDGLYQMIEIMVGGF